MKNHARIAVVATAAPLIFWLMATPLAQPLAWVIAPLCLLRAVLPTRYIPWLRTHTGGRP